MTKNVFIIAAIGGFIATAGAAQTTAFNNEDASADAVEDLEEQIEEDRERDIGRFGNEGREIGSYGSLAVRGTSVSSDGDNTTDVGLGLRYGTFDGINGLDITASLAYGEFDGEKTKDTLLAGVDYRRDLTATFFAYGKLEAAYDNLADSEGEFTQDIFAGAGLGYRIYNTADTQWSVQAGPGYRAAKRVTSMEGDPRETEDISEAAASVSSNVFRSLTETTYVTNDTDVIYSETATTVTNELALNVAMTDTLSLRTSYTTNFNSESDDDLSDAVNTLGVSVIYNFN